MGIGDRIKKVRKSAGLTQKKFAQIVGIDQSHLSKLERGTAEPSHTVVKLICVAAHVREEWLRHGKGPRIGDPDRESVSDFLRSLDGLRYSSLVVMLSTMAVDISHEIQQLKSWLIIDRTDWYGLELLPLEEGDPTLEVIKGHIQTVKSRLQELDSVLSSIRL